MERYKDIQVIGTETPYKATTVYPFVPEAESDYYVISTSGDRFDILSQQFYGSTDYWWAIASANPDVRKDTLFIEPGLQLRIPSPLTRVLQAYESVNATR